MKKFWNKSLSKFSKKTYNFEGSESIFIPFEVINDSNKNSQRILRTKNFNKTKKIKHPSGTTKIRIDKYQNLIEQSKIREKEISNLKLTSYKNPTKKIYERKKKEKGHWKY